MRVFMNNSCSFVDYASFSESDIGPEGVFSLVDVLKVNSTLTGLCLEGDQFLSTYFHLFGLPIGMLLVTQAYHQYQKH